MQWQGIKIYIVAISLVAGLTAFMGAQWLYTNLNFQRPLKKELDDNKLISSYQIQESNDGYRLVVSLQKNGNLMQTYRQIYSEVQGIMGRRPFVIEIVNRPNDRLNNVFYRGQFAIHEAMFKGNFREMADSLTNYARQGGVSSQVYMDNDNIYWQLQDGDNYLYNVIPRMDYIDGRQTTPGMGSERGQGGA